MDRMVRQLTRFDGDTRVLDLGPATAAAPGTSPATTAVR
ncbi:hypothetical protein I551_9006 [Mycobacterium ulcerans str. Harvey]|uniref:Uncharacterized protein n=1 Tax=Mycobacterium ulcerans str. Harvey TaxID=1299332 RepID=A0ABN0R9T3_MYCUL|nr:hypothetical protein I551_9006 [Mycobacterium ulcerans str. Harvey]